MSDTPSKEPADPSSKTGSNPTVAKGPAHGRPKGGEHAKGHAKGQGQVKGQSAKLKRRWPRRTLIGVNVVVLVCLVAVGSAYGYVRHLVSDIRTLPSPNETQPGHNLSGSKQPKTDYAHGLKPENILLIGNETRQGLTPAEQEYLGSSVIYSGSLADIMMVLHLDPAKRTASVLSVPRDLFTPMPTGSPVGPYQKLDAALNDGKEGPDNLVTAVQEDLGIPINHFIEINFNGFMNSVNALGGINVYFPRPVFDAESRLNIPTKGCYHLDGEGALELVRARHLQYEPAGEHDLPRYEWPQEAESDLARIVRTHFFIKLVAAKARSEYSNFFDMHNFLDAVVAQMTVDQPLKSELFDIAETYIHINLGTLPELTLPTTGVADYYYGVDDIGDVVFPVQPLDDNVIDQWDPGALEAPVKPKSVSVVSITGSYDAAIAAGEGLKSDGLDVANETVGEVPADTSETLVMYHSYKDLGQAMDVMKYLSGAVMLQQSSSVPAGTVTVDLGSTVDVKSHPLPTTTTTAAPGATTTTGPATTTTQAVTSTSRARTTTTRATTTTTTVPTPGDIAPSSSKDVTEPWDPRSCPAGAKVITG